MILNPNVVHFDKECFGEDAEEFVPERWLQADEKKVAYMARHEIGFGTGPRVCLGKHVSETYLAEAHFAVLPELSPCTAFYPSAPEFGSY